MPRTFTWFHGKKPTEYAELTVGLQWTGPTMVSTELGSWSQTSTQIRNVLWEDFRDPAKDTYRTYVVRQDDAEREFDGILRVAASEPPAADLDPAWRDALTTIVGGMSFADWGVAMTMQHVQRFCLGSTIAQSAQLQVCDHLRHAQRNLEWFDLTAGEVHGDEADGARQAWMECPALQPLRCYVENALVIDDWAEVIVAVNLALGGMLQPFLREVYATGGRAYRDLGTAVLGHQRWTDTKRHLDWSEALVRLAVESDSHNGDVVRGWLATSLPRAESVLVALADALPPATKASAACDVARIEMKGRVADLGLDPVPQPA